MIKKNFNTYEQLNDGRLSFGKKRTVRNEMKKVVRTDFDTIGELFYAIKSLNYDDFKIRFGIDRSVDLKIMVYNTQELTDSHLIKINEDIYEIIKKDVAPDGVHVFLYLEKEKS